MLLEFSVTSSWFSPSNHSIRNDFPRCYAIRGRKFHASKLAFPASAIIKSSSRETASTEIAKMICKNFPSKRYQSMQYALDSCTSRKLDPLQFSFHSKSVLSCADAPAWPTFTGMSLCVASHIRSTSAQLKTPQFVIYSIENLGRTQKLWAFQFPSTSSFICSPSHDDLTQIRSLKFTRALLLAINVVFSSFVLGLKYAKFIHGRREKSDPNFEPFA